MNLRLSYCHEKLSLAVFEMCISTQSLKNRLRSSLRHGFTAFPDETFSAGLREQLSEIKAALAGVRIGSGLENYPDAIDRMKPSIVRRLVNEIISLREGVAKEYYKRIFQGESQSKDSPDTLADVARKAAQLLGH